MCILNAWAPSPCGCRNARWWKIDGVESFSGRLGSDVDPVVTPQHHSLSWEAERRPHCPLLLRGKNVTCQRWMKYYLWYDLKIKQWMQKYLVQPITFCLLFHHTITLWVAVGWRHFHRGGALLGNLLAIGAAGGTSNGKERNLFITPSITVGSSQL